MNNLIDNDLPPEGVSYLGEQYKTNSLVNRSSSHHKSKEKLPGGDRYTKITKWTRRIGIVILSVIFLLLAYQIITILNVGGAISAPDAPSEAQAQKDFLLATPPKYDEMKYISDKSSGIPTVENVEVGRVTTSTGQAGSVFACDATADVKFSNSSINSTSKMRLKYTYNSLLGKWEAGTFTSESTNYRPNGAPDITQIQDDAISIMSGYDENSAKSIQGCDIIHKGELTKDGGEITFICTKKGGGSEVSYNYSYWEDWMENQTNGRYDLVKTMKVRVKWSEVDGWVANVTWLGTVGENVPSNEEDSDETEENDSEDEEVRQELSCFTGQSVELTGEFYQDLLTLDKKTRFTIDGEVIETKTVNVVREINQDETEGSVSIQGTISVVDGTVTLTI